MCGTEQEPKEEMGTNKRISIGKDRLFLLISHICKIYNNAEKFWHKEEVNWDSRSWEHLLDLG